MPIKMALQGPSGSGKTYSALLLAYGLSQNWSKIAVIDTENRSSELYADLGPFLTLSISAPYSPEKYVEAVHLCEKTGIDVIIIDSLSHEWDGSGGILDIHGNMAGNSFTNWSKLTPRHNDFVQTILQSRCHIIGTLRSKQDYVLSEKNGKMVPEKVGLKAITRDGMDYEFTIVFDLDYKHQATCSKDRTGLFSSQPEFRITEQTGYLIRKWCIGTTTVPNYPDGLQKVEQRINDCLSLPELLDLFHDQAKETQNTLAPLFTARRKELLPINHNSSHLKM